MSVQTVLRPGVASAATLLLVGALAVTSQFVPTGAWAQSVESRRDQPTPATLPDPTAQRQREGDRQLPQVAPPEAINSSTAIVPSDRKGKAAYTNPLDHLPARDRMAAGGGRRE